MSGWQVIARATAGVLFFCVPGCESTLDVRERAVSVAPTEFETRFPEEYTIVAWEVTATKEAKGW